MKKKVLAFALVALTCWMVVTGILTISAHPAATLHDGWSVRSSGTILYTSDGENTWNEQLIPFSGDSSQLFLGVNVCALGAIVSFLSVFIALIGFLGVKRFRQNERKANN